jgi:hypothetical protein
MEMKYCNKCKTDKTIDNFRFRKDKNRYLSECRECVRKYQDEYNHKYYIKNSDKIKKSAKNYAKTHKKERKIRTVIYRKKNTDKIREYSTKYYEDHKNEKQAYDKIYRKNNKKRINNYKNQYTIERCKVDPTYKLRIILRSRIREAVKNGKNHMSAVKLLGCSIEFFRQYLESKFYPHPISGKMMSWNNYGNHGWHIDHIIPLALFDLTDENKFTKACNYTNLQPLWDIDHFEKTTFDNETIKKGKVHEI